MFHFSQIIIRYVNKIGALKRFYQNEEFLNFIKSILLLPYCPISRIEFEFNKIRQIYNYNADCLLICDFFKQQFLENERKIFTKK
jgi:hypothetical protein